MPNLHGRNGCGDDVPLIFDHKDFFCCPRHKGTERQYEYLRNISGRQVIGTLEHLIAEQHRSRPECFARASFRRALVLRCWQVRVIYGIGPGRATLFHIFSLGFFLKKGQVSAILKLCCRGEKKCFEKEKRSGLAG